MQPNLPKTKLTQKIRKIIAEDYDPSNQELCLSISAIIQVVLKMIGEVRWNFETGLRFALLGYVLQL